MNEFVKYILETLHYDCEEISFTGHVVLTADDIPELKKSTLPEMFPQLYDEKYFGMSPAELLWDKIFLNWLFDDSGFRWADWGVILETGAEVKAIPVCIRKPLTGFKVPFTWSGAECSPDILLCLAQYYDYGATCIRFYKKWRMSVNKLYTEGCEKFSDRRMEYISLVVFLNRRVADLLQIILHEVPKLEDFSKYLYNNPTCCYKELTSTTNPDAETLDAVLDIFLDFFTMKIQF